MHMIIMTHSNNALDVLVQWAQDSGIRITGIKNIRSPGRDIGVYATRDIEVGSSTCFSY